MKSLLTPILVVIALTFGACSSTGSLPTPTPGQVDQAITKAQEFTRQLCGFVPTANTIANLLKVFGVNSVADLTAIAQQVCTAVAPIASTKSSRKRMAVAPPTVRGVPIRGTFVR